MDDAAVATLSAVVVEAAMVRPLASLLALVLLAGCASFGEGVGRAVLGQLGEGGEDTRACEIEGAAFTGTLQALETQRGQPPIGSVPGDQRSLLKVMMVHGISRHEPGYSGTVSANLARSLGLDVMSPQIKITGIVHPDFPGETLATFTVRRFTDAAREREMLFYELTWSGLSDPARERLAFDNSEVFARQRAGFNRAAKAFANNALVDPLVYVGRGRQRILRSVQQGLCWNYSSDWDNFPETNTTCSIDEPTFGNRIDLDSFFFVTHSLGSRIVLDALQSTAEQIDAALPISPAAAGLKVKLQDQPTTVFMLANQLPLLQAGFEPVPVAGEVGAFCRPGGARLADRLFQQTNLIAFNDPNDIMSYPIPDDFTQYDIDSRLCPRVANVTLNVANVISVPGAGTFANPLAAHSDYEADERVIALMTAGLGQPETLPVVTERCTWIRTEEDLR
jgi:pimeloyl-ACP methyl ester carboxylesterase